MERCVNKTPFKLHLWSKVLRLCPPGMPGKTRLARVILSPYLRLRDVCVDARYGCTFLVPSLREPIAFHLAVDGLYEPLVVNFLLRRLTAGMTFVDVGANIGVFTILAARQVGPTGRVLALEPSPRVFPYLEYNVKINGLSNVCLKQRAAYDRDVPSLPLWEAPVEHFGMGALAPQFHTAPTAVPGRTLDHILIEEGIGHVDLLKVDVEGFEAAVFRGAKQLLTGERPPVILFEFCDWAEARVPGGKKGDAQRVLHAAGYQIWRIADFGRAGAKPLKDVLTEGYETLVAVHSQVGR